MSATTDEIVYNALSDAGVAMARLTWGPKSCVPPTPYGVYEELPHSMFADNGNLPTVPRYRCTIHTDTADAPVIDAFRQAVESLGTYISHPGEWDDEREVFTHAFDVSVIRRG